MAEALQLFAASTSCRWFRTTPIILFLNKKDLFAEKIETFPLTVAFPEYTGTFLFRCECRMCVPEFVSGAQNYEEGAYFIQKQFEKNVEGKLDKFYTHRTCATDTKNIQFVMDACFDIILTKTLNHVRL